MDDPRSQLDDLHPLQKLWPYFSRAERKAWVKLKYDVSAYQRQRGSHPWNCAVAAFKEDERQSALRRRAAELEARKAKAAPGEDAAVGGDVAGVTPGAPAEVTPSVIAADGVCGAGSEPSAHAGSPPSVAASTEEE